MIENHGELNVLLDHVAVRSPKALRWQAIALHIDLNPGCTVRLTRQTELPRPLTDSGDGIQIAAIHAEVSGVPTADDLTGDASNVRRFAGAWVACVFELGNESLTFFHGISEVRRRGHCYSD